MRALTVTRYVLAAVIAVLLIAPLAVGVVTRSQMIGVEGGSMVPTYQWGDLIVVDTTGDSPVRVGDVVTVRRPTGVLYTHRVIDITAEGAITTQGDANPTPDTPTITRTDIVGTVTTHIPQPAARLITVSQSLPGRVSLGVLLMGLLLVPFTSRRAHSATSSDAPRPVASPRNQW